EEEGGETEEGVQLRREQRTIPRRVAIRRGRGTSPAIPTTLPNWLCFVGRINGDAERERYEGQWEGEEEKWKMIRWRNR
ncbi:hypothetical protein PMAYCL1PPCAC_23556, partial [Pristionchus mayeri]